MIVLLLQKNESPLVNCFQQIFILYVLSICILILVLKVFFVAS